MKVAGVEISHPDKVWYPEDGFTKLDIVEYYDVHADLLRPFLKGRPLTAERCPDGLRGSCFFQKDFAKGLPEGVPTVPVRSESAGKTVHYVVGGARKTTAALVNLGCIALHAMNCERGSFDRPDWLAFDLDPSSGKFSDAARAGLALKKILEEAGLVSYPKTSGSRGLHVLVSLRRGPGQDRVREYAAEVGRRLAEREPKTVTMEMSKSRRGRRVFVDTLRNAFGQTLAVPYAVRRRPGAPVSTPLAWDEVSPKLDPGAFTIRTIDRRLGRKDPWTDFWRRRRALPDSLD